MLQTSPHVPHFKRILDFGEARQSFPHSQIGQNKSRARYLDGIHDFLCHKNVILIVTNRGKITA
jgi:hypothetical protein